MCKRIHSVQPEHSLKMNDNQIPPSYLPGLQTLENFNATEMALWLLSEMHEREHLLAGSYYDQPVQAILNHAKYLTETARGILIHAAQDCVADWRRIPNDR